MNTCPNGATVFPPYPLPRRDGGPRHGPSAAPGGAPDDRRAQVPLQERVARHAPPGPPPAGYLQGKGERHEGLPRPGPSPGAASRRPTPTVRGQTAMPRRQNPCHCGGKLSNIGCYQLVAAQVDSSPLRDYLKPPFSRIGVLPKAWPGTTRTGGATWISSRSRVCSSGAAGSCDLRIWGFEIVSNSLITSDN